MSTKTQVSYECDYDGKAISNGDHHERIIALDGQARRLDLCTKHSDKLDTDTGRYMRSGVRVSIPGSRSKRRNTATRRRSAEIRAWARGQGLELNDRGRIPASVIARYEQAH